MTPGQTLYVEVGGNGKDGGEGGAGGFNGGATGAGGGGGATDVRTSPESSGLSPDHRLIVAAGGGGGGASGEEPGGAGGAAGSPGGATSYSGGGAGTATEGGLGAFGCEVSGQGGNGQLGSGGAGGNSFVSTGPGGGGGGGYYGGGGGGGACLVGSSGGGGGSSLVPPLGLPALASPTAEPEIQISYTLVPPSIELISPTDGASYVQGQAVNAVYFCTPPEGATVATCAGPVANGSPLDTAALGSHTFKVFAEDSDGATEAESVNYTVVAAPAKPVQPEPVVTPPAPLPDTTIGTHPKESIKTTKKKVKVKFSFSSNVAGASFECKLDKGSFEPCSSPKNYKVQLGKHKFSVQATSAAGTDPSAAIFTFKVKKKQ